MLLTALIICIQLDIMDLSFRITLLGLWLNVSQQLWSCYDLTTLSLGKFTLKLGNIVQLETCLTADPGVMILIPPWSHTFKEIDHEIISMAILIPSADSRRAVVSYKGKYVQKVLVNRLVPYLSFLNICFGYTFRRFF